MCGAEGVGGGVVGPRVGGWSFSLYYGTKDVNDQNAFFYVRDVRMREAKWTCKNRIAIRTVRKLK